MDIKEELKNPIIYFIAVPLLIGLWPLMMWSVYIPDVENEWKDLNQDYLEGHDIMREILVLDPERVDLAKAKKNANKFDYAKVVADIAGSCGITASQYSLRAGLVNTSGRQKFRDATVNLKGIPIEKIAKFFSNMQLRWTNLQCVSLKLNKKKGLPNSWDADFDFKYYY